MLSISKATSIFYKLCLAQSTAKLSALLSDAFAGSADAYKIFLDLLEEKEPAVRSRLNTHDLKSIFYELSRNFPKVLRKIDNDTFRYNNKAITFLTYGFMFHDKNKKNYYKWR